MPRYAAFLRAVNVGGTGKLAMQELRDMCTGLGFKQVKTYIASGNVAFDSALPVAAIKETLETSLHDCAGKPVSVFLRTHQELCEIVAETPFADAAGNKVTAVLLDSDPKAALDAGLKGQTTEQVAIGQGVLYVHYPDGMGRSKLKLLGAQHGSARNMNTIAKMVQLTA